MKALKSICLGIFLGSMVSSSHAQKLDAVQSSKANKETSPVVMPISNPIYNDIAIPTTRLTPIYIHHNFPDKVNINGGSVTVGGSATVIALQIEYAITENISLVANKDGYIDIDADRTLEDEDGFGDLGFGVKWRFVHGDQN